VGKGNGVFKFHKNLKASLSFFALKHTESDVVGGMQKWKNVNNYTKERQKRFF
jgi:hypothetical protein